MAIYVDRTRNYEDWKWQAAHMMTDGPIEELHEMADKIGLKRSWFQNHPRFPHYDISKEKRRLAIKNGALAVTSGEMLTRCKKQALAGESET